jgi:hypothetical protein
MAVELSLGTLETDAPALEAPGWDTPFRFAILGDFTGRGNRGATDSVDDIAARKGKKMDRENFEQVLADMAPSLTLEIKGVKGGPIEIMFTEIEHFDADEIIARVEKFEDCSSPKESVALLSGILHHPDFRALEAVWRGLYWFVKKSWTGDNGVEIVLYDLARSELVDCVNGNDDLSQSPLYSWLVEKALKGYNAQPWGAVIGLYEFNVNADDAQVLGRIAKIVRHASAPFLAELAAKPWEKSFKPAKDDAESWEALRQDPASSMLGLAAPGFLLRPPYGVGTKAVDKIAYEEYKTPKDAEHYLLGNPALFCGSLLAKSFTKKNWQFKPGADLEQDQMAMHVARDEDDEEVLVTVGAWLLQKQVDQMTKMGFMTLRGVKGRNHVQLARFLPLAQGPVDQPSADLIGSWGQKALKGVPRTPTKPRVGVKLEAVSETTMSESSRSRRGRTGGEAAAFGATAASSSGSGGFDMDNLDHLMAEADKLEAKLKAEREAAEAASSGGDSFSSDFGSDMSFDSPSDTPSEDAPSETSSSEMDPELAALLGDSGGETPAEEPPAADSDMDPDVAAMLKELEGGSN